METTTIKNRTIKEMAIQQMDSIYETLSVLPKTGSLSKPLFHNFNGQAHGVACLAARILYEAGEKEDAKEVLNYYNEILSKKMKALYDEYQEVEE